MLCSSLVAIPHLAYDPLATYMCKQTALKGWDYPAYYLMMVLLPAKGTAP